MADDMLPLDTKITKIFAESSPSFVRAAFDFYEKSTVFAVVRPDISNDDRLTGADTFELDSTETSGWVDMQLRPNWSTAPAQIVFSSGTQGRPKAIVLSHGNLADVVKRLNEAMGVTPEIREYIGVPVTYSFGLGRARAVATAGGRFFIPEKFDPAEIKGMLKRDEINAISVVPSLCRILIKSKTLFADVAHKVRWIEIGSQFMSEEEKRAMRDLFPNARILQHYGLTEASRSTFLDVSQADANDLGSVGRVDGPVDVRIGESGAICLRGAHVALGQLTSAGLIAPLTHSDTWLETKDRGEIRGDFLYFLGRLDDQINISGIKVSADQLEEHLRKAVPGKEDHFAIAVADDPLRGQIALLTVERSIQAEVSALEDSLSDIMAHYGVAGGDGFRVFMVDALPVTGSGKVQRAAITQTYLAQCATAPTAAPDDVGTVLGVFKSHFPRTEISGDMSFEMLGGDSLSYLSVALDLERLLGGLPEKWEKQPISVLDEIVPSKRLLGRVDMQTALRAVAICLIVLGHFEAFNYGGTGAFLLFLIAGMNFANLTIPAVIQSNNVAPIFILLLRISFLTWAYISLHWLLTGYGGVFGYLFINNWIAPDYPGGVWFVAVYIQTMILLAIPLAFGQVRRRIKKYPFEVSAALAVGFLCTLALSEQLVDFHYLYRRLPHLLGWMFACGIVINYADTALRRSTALLLFALGAWLFSGMGVPGVSFFILAVPVLIFVPYISLPRLAIPFVRLIAGGSLIIYLSHFQFRQVLEFVMTPDPLLASVFAILGGVVCYILYRPIDDIIRRALTKVLT